MWRKKGNIPGSDLREGFMCVLSVRVPDPEVEGQTKTKLGNPEVRTATEKVCAERLTHALEENPEVAKQKGERFLKELEPEFARIEKTGKSRFVMRPFIEGGLFASKYKQIDNESVDY